MPEGGAGTAAAAETLDEAADGLGFRVASKSCDDAGNLHAAYVRWSTRGVYIAETVLYGAAIAGGLGRGTLRLVFLHPDGEREHGAEFECGLDGWIAEDFGGLATERDPNALDPRRTLIDCISDADLAVAAHQEDLAARDIRRRPELGGPRSGE